MQKEAKQFWDAIAGKVRETVRGMTRKALQIERYDVTTAPNSATGKIGVTLPFGGEEIMIPYSAECAGAQVGDTVLVVWWNSMSTAKAWFMGNGPDQAGIESGSNYCKFPDGTIIQWGVESLFSELVGYQISSAAVPLPYPMPNGNYCVSITVTGVTNPAQRQVGVGARSAASFVAIAQNNYPDAWPNVYVCWFLVGRWK